jgi:hypothetical protein
MAKNAFTGTWKLLSYEILTEGRVTYPYGKNPVGYIIYAEDGYMSVAFMEPNRNRFAAGSLRAGTKEEKVGALDSYQSYSGRYEIRGDAVVHHVEVSLFPNNRGIDLVRTFKFKGSRLTLTPPPTIVNGKEQTSQLVWERIKTG